MEIIVRKCSGFTRSEVPNENETFGTDFDIEKLVPLISSVTVYLREDDSPVWVIDIEFNEGRVFYIKLPKEMTENQVMKYFNPMKEALEKFKQSKMN